MGGVKNKKALTFIFVTVALDMLGVGVVIPILPDVIRKFFRDPNEITRLFGYFVSVYSVVQFLASPILGILSDRFGRRPILLISLLGTAVDYVVMAIAPSIEILFLGRIISGLTGASLTVANSYIADISTDKNRAGNFGLIGAAFGIGFIAGPLIGGLMGQLGPYLPFWTAALLNLVNFLFCLYYLPESLPVENRRRIELKKMNPFSTLYDLYTNRLVIVFAIVYAFLFLANNVHPSIWTLYTEYKFGWTPFQVGLSLCFVGLIYGLSQGFLTRRLTALWGEEKALLVGISFHVICFFLYAVAPRGWMMYLIMLVSGLAGLCIPSLQSIMTKACPPDRQGELQGSLVSLSSISSFVAPLLYTAAFRYGTYGGGPSPEEGLGSGFESGFRGQALPWLSGAPYFLASGISALCLVIIIRAVGRKQRA